MHVFVVYGATGEYADRHDWPVLAFADEMKANEFRDSCQREYEAALAAVNNDLHELSRKKYETIGQASLQNRPDCKANLQRMGLVSDPHFSVDYTGTSYYIVKIPYRS